jgi:hypothetical protein
VCFERDQDLELLAGNSDHVRRYGPDFAGRLALGGFETKDFQAPEGDAEMYGLDKAERIYMGSVK